MWHKKWLTKFALRLLQFQNYGTTNFWVLAKSSATTVDWTQDWTEGLDRGNGLTESCAHPILKQHTHYYTTVYLHHMNWIQGRRPSLISISIQPDKVSASVRAIQYVYLHWHKPNKQWPPSNSSTVNMHSRTLILSNKQSLSSGKSPHVCLL